MIADTKLLQMLSMPNEAESAEILTDTPVSGEVEASPVDTNDSQESASSDNESDKESEVPTDSLDSARLSELFNEEALKKLSELSQEKILGLSVKELLAEVNRDSIAGPWEKSVTESGNEILSGTYSLENYEVASDLAVDVLRQGQYTSTHVKSLAIQKDSERWSISIVLGNKPSLEQKDLQMAQYANYRYTAVSSGNSLQYFSEEQVAVPSTERPYTPKTDISAIPVQVLSEGETKKLRVPIAVLGDWKHDSYGDLSFTQQDFDEMRQNFSSKIIGYEPPLFLGHPKDNQPTSEGLPAEGFLETLSQEGDVLYGDFEVVNDDTYSSVGKGHYRYASGEFLRNYKNKRDGAKAGTALVGVALTNRPFLTGLPRVSTLSDNDHVSTILLTDSTPKTMTQPTETPNVNEANGSELEAFKKEVYSEFNSLKQNYADEVDGLKQKLSEAEEANKTATQKLSEVTTERDDLAKKIDEIEAAKRQEEITVKLSEINELAIPQEEKEKYSDLIKSGTLGDNEALIMDSLRAMSAKLSDTVTEQHGSTTATQALNDSSVSDPYKDTIERNQSLAKAKEAKLEQLINLA